MEWKQIIIDGEEWHYEVSDSGDVRNTKTGKVLKQRKDGNGCYLIVGLYKDGKQRMFLVHRLVATMFIPNPNNLDTVNHINENKLDNRSCNLEWLSMLDNINYGTRAKRGSETRRCKRSSKTRSRKVMAISLTETKVIMFQSIKQAEKLGFDKSHISKCCIGKQKTHKGYTWKYI